MRLIAFFISFLLIAGQATGQRDYLRQPPPEEPVKEDTVVYNADDYLDNFPKGVALFKQKRYAAAEKYLRKSFKANPADETARYLYYSLLYQGHDLEAAIFKTDNPKYTFAFPAYKRGFESVYISFGPRVSAQPDDAGNIYFGGYGTLFRLRDDVRFWHTVSYVEQNDNLGSYKQGEYFSGMYYQLRGGWSVNPTLHYIYTDYKTFITEQNDVTYTNVYDSPADDITYVTTARQNIRYSFEGATHYLNVVVPFSKRINTLTLEVSPAAYLVSNKSTGGFTYTENGVTDSFQRNLLLGSEIYAGDGNGQLDSSFTSVIGQIGLSMGYQLPLKGEPIHIRLGGALQFAKNMASVFTWNAYILGRITPYFWVHANYTMKGAIPLALHQDGIFLNHYNKIKDRAGISLQLNPLKRFSPIFTYQYELQERTEDGMRLTYNSVYLTLKYRL